MARTFLPLLFQLSESRVSLPLKSRTSQRIGKKKNLQSLQRAWRIIMRRLMNSTRLVVSVSVSHEWQRHGGLLAYESKCERWPNIICECFTLSGRDMHFIERGRCCICVCMNIHFLLQLLQRFWIKTIFYCDCSEKGLYMTGGYKMRGIDDVSWKGKSLQMLIKNNMQLRIIYKNGNMH